VLEVLGWPRLGGRFVFDFVVAGVVEGWRVRGDRTWESSLAQWQL